VGTKVSVRICCFCLLLACKDRPRMILQNIHNHVTDYTGPNLDCIMNPHHFEHLKYHTKGYQEQLKYGWKCHIGKIKLQTSSMLFFTGTAFNIMYFIHQLCTKCFIFCLSNKLRKHDLKYFLVINIISLDTHFRVRTQMMNFKFTKMISYGETHT